MEREVESSESVEKEGEGGKSLHHPNRVVTKGSNGKKGKSCKGCLYYSSIRKSNARNPLCVGVSRTFQQGIAFVPPPSLFTLF